MVEGPLLNSSAGPWHLGEELLAQSQHLAKSFLGIDVIRGEAGEQSSVAWVIAAIKAFLATPRQFLRNYSPEVQNNR